MTDYLIKSILCSGILIIAYHLFLEREKMPVFNRFYLLAALVFSLAVPLISFDLTLQPTLEPVVSRLPDVDKGIEAIPYFSPPEVEYRQALSSLSFDLWAIASYLITGLLLLRFAFNILSILRLKSKCKLHVVSEANLVLVPFEISTYTFLDNIFIPEKSFNNQQFRGEVFTHEMAHVRQKHSLDMLFIELLHALMWFNPFLFFYKKAIRLNHEFLADEAVLTKYSDVKSYQLLLLDSILQKQRTSLTSSFNYSITKKRLAMMTKIKNLNRQYLKQTLTVVLSAVLTIVFSEKIYSQVQAEGEKIAAALPEKVFIPFAKPGKANSQDKPVDKRKKIQGIVPGPGASKSEVEELYGTIEKHTTYVTNKKGRTDPIVKMPPKLENRMYELFSKMNKEQLLASEDSGLLVFQAKIPVRAAPTPEQFESWKQADVFGVWINEKHVPNTELDKYKYSDIAEFWSSKLYGAALKGRSYKYQLDLTTNDQFDKTYQARVNDRISILRVGWVGERPESFGKKAK